MGSSLNKENIESWFNYWKSLEHILECCKSIELISDRLILFPIYNKDTINATSIILNKWYSIDYIVEYATENGWDDCWDYQELIRQDYYLPTEIWN